MLRGQAVIGLLVSMICAAAFANSFHRDQMRYPRVREARAETQAAIDSLYDRVGVKPDSLRVFLRAFKRERVIEVWAGRSANSMRLLTSYRFTAFCGRLGPKRAEGDRQIPEGVYHIDRFNPVSAYHLSLGINYPNKSDRIRASSSDPGCDIFIHGRRVTIGCIPIGNEAIKELYTICVDARSSGQRRIPVHIFPSRMSSKDDARMLESIANKSPHLSAFWEELRVIYEAFEKRRSVPSVRIDDLGAYHLR